VLVALISAWTIVASLVFSESTVQNLALGDRGPDRRASITRSNASAPASGASADCSCDSYTRSHAPPKGEIIVTTLDSRGKELHMTEVVTQAARSPLAPFAREAALQRAPLAGDAENSGDPARASLAYSIDYRWRNSAEFAGDTAFLTRKWH
jgi:hypothetical protein